MVEDRSRRLCRAIVTGKLAELKEILKQYQKDDNFLLDNIDTTKIDDMTDKKLQLPAKVSPFDLAIYYKQDEALETLLDHCSGT